MAGLLQTKPGRHLIVLLSNGFDQHSMYAWNRVREYVGSQGIAVFGIRTSPPPDLPPAYSHFDHGTVLVRRPEEAFDALCEGTGGLVLDADEATAGPALELILHIVRERYVLEFKRPRNGVAGLHLLEVTVRDRDALVLSSGVSVALPDPALAKDPSIVPSDESQAPVLGKRRNVKDR